MRTLLVRMGGGVALAMLLLSSVPVVYADAPKNCIGCNLAGQALENADFSGGTFVGNTFEKADLRGSSFRQARILAANFQGADLRNAHFDGAECLSCNFEGAQIDGTTFSGARMVAANFLRFRGALADDQLRALLDKCVSCNFQGAAFSGRDFSGLTLISVDFSGADLRNAKFDGSVFCWYAGNGTTRSTNCNKLAGAKLSGASFNDISVCDDPVARVGCTAVDKDTLRRLSGGAIPTG